MHGRGTHSVPNATDQNASNKKMSSHRKKKLRVSFDFAPKTHHPPQKTAWCARFAQKKNCFVSLLLAQLYKTTWTIFWISFVSGTKNAPHAAKKRPGGALRAPPGLVFAARIALLAQNQNETQKMVQVVLYRSHFAFIFGVPGSPGGARGRSKHMFLTLLFGGGHGRARAAGRPRGCGMLTSWLCVGVWWMMWCCRGQSNTMRVWFLRVCTRLVSKTCV